ncbi:MAG: hypothetical protein RIT04_355 [Candidatus Parcubacteria bacterium]|jgi:hypothetical protein
MKTMTYGEASREHYVSRWTSSGSGKPFEDWMRELGISIVSRFTASAQQQEAQPTKLQLEPQPSQPRQQTPPVSKQASLFGEEPQLPRKKAVVDGRVHRYHGGRNWEKIPGRHEFVDTPPED